MNSSSSSISRRFRRDRKFLGLLLRIRLDQLRRLLLHFGRYVVLGEFAIEFANHVIEDRLEVQVRPLDKACLAALTLPIDRVAGASGRTSLDGCTRNRRG